MDILVTAGGMREKIDAVRGITNTSSGRLGSLIADELATFGDIRRIYYLRGVEAAIPSTDKAEIIDTRDSLELEAAAREILTTREIGLIVHSMAVSDYRVRSVTTGARLLDAAKSQPDSPERLFELAGHLDRSGKIGSDERDLVLTLEPTPKIIGIMRELTPRAILVGFKLLDNTTHSELVRAARALMLKNGCAFVLANDMRDITGDKHIGYLIDSSGRELRFETKQEIARGVRNAVAGIGEKV